MSLYADTGFLVSLHATDANSTAARVWMKRHGEPMPWTWLHEVEFRNAIRLQAFRGQIKREEVDVILHKQALGLDNGVYFPAAPANAEVIRRVEALGSAFTAALGTRTLDTFHVAQALVLDATVFLTFDLRQARLAKEAGLRVPKLGDYTS
jgi:predicted nucleic acid-binding protein